MRPRFQAENCSGVAADTLVLPPDEPWTSSDSYHCSLLGVAFDLVQVYVGKEACLVQGQAPFVEVGDMVFDLGIEEVHLGEAVVCHSYRSCMDGQEHCHSIGRMVALDAVGAVVALPCWDSDCPCWAIAHA